MIQEGKALLKSKTVWFSLIYLAVSLAGLFGYQEFQPNPKLVDAIGAVTSIVFVLLRLVTKEPITRLK